MRRRRFCRGTDPVVLCATPVADVTARRPSLLAVPSKTYTAVLEGRMTKAPKSGEIVKKMRPDVNDRPRQVRSLRI